MENKMATSNRTTRTSRSTRTARTDDSRSTSTRRTSTPRTDASSTRRAKDVSRIKHYTFRYNLDRVSRKAGSSGVVIASNGAGGALNLSLQEARSLYNFLDRHFNA